MNSLLLTLSFCLGLILSKSHQLNIILRVSEDVWVILALLLEIQPESFNPVFLGPIVFFLFLATNLSNLMEISLDVDPVKFQITLSKIRAIHAR